ncbi:MAG: hypothetical protein Fur007_02730 [Rhodoferax sp.]
MTATWVSLLLVVLALAMLPLGLKWLQRRVGHALGGASNPSRVVSAVAVGPQQRVVTVEIGPPQARVWLTVGVTAQSVTALHTQAAPDGATPAETSGPAAPVFVVPQS